MANGCHIGQCGRGTLPSLQEVLLDNIAPKEESDRKERVGYKWKTDFGVSPEEKSESSFIDL